MKVQPFRSERFTSRTYSSRQCSIRIKAEMIDHSRVGGEFARELEKEGVDGGIDFALGELRKIFGSKIDQHFIKGDATRWGSDPLYFREPIGDRIYFSGEACSKLHWSTVHGAYETGVRAAKSVDLILA